MAHGLSCSTTSGIFLDQGLNRCLLHWQADSFPLSHQGSLLLWVLSLGFLSSFFWVVVLSLPGEGNGNSLQYSCLENPMGRGAWWAAVHGVSKSGTRLSDFTLTHWRRKRQPSPVFLPGESQGGGSLVGCRLWGRTESDTTEAT